MNETHINHEVRIQVMEASMSKIDARFDKIEAKMDTQFYSIVILLVASLIIPMFLKFFKLV